MNLSDWVPALSTSSLIGVALSVLWGLILIRVKASVKHEFDGKLEDMRAANHKSTESLKADLRAKEAQIEALRAGAISSLASRQAALDKRRIEAVEQLWSAVISFAPAKSTARIIAAFNFNGAAAEAAKNPRFGEVIGAIGGQVDLRSMQTDAGRARPFVSEFAWALFSAYHSILSVALIRICQLKEGLDVSGMVDEDAIRKLVKAALPHQREYIEKYDTGAYYHLLDEIESRLLAELRSVLAGADSNRQMVEQAGDIVRLSESVNASLYQPGSVS